LNFFLKRNRSSASNIVLFIHAWLITSLFQNKGIKITNQNS
jgi:hypothetical protein